MDWSAYAGGRDLSHLFLTEDVTKGPTMIHAYGYDLATKYLRKIREVTALPRTQA